MVGTNVGIDLGTSSVLIYVEGKGVVLNEPSVVAYDQENGEILAVGRKAYSMLGKNPDSIRVVKPMRDGVVSDFRATQHILKYHLSHVCKNMIFKPNIIVCVPSGVTSLEQRTILDLITAAGAAKACLIEEPMAAALGSGIAPNHPSGVLVADIGGGTTDVAVITMGSICISRSLRVAGNSMDEAIIRYFKRHRNVQFGERTAEQIKTVLGCAYARKADLAMIAKGKHTVSGMPYHLEITSTEVMEALKEPLRSITNVISSVLEVTPPELAGDLTTNGLMLTGGGALLYGIDRLLQEELKIPVFLAEKPLDSVALGTGIALKDLDLLARNGYLLQTREEITGYQEY